MINPVLAAYQFLLDFYATLPPFVDQFIVMIIVAFCIRALFKNFAT